MPIYDQSYKHWDGQLSQNPLKWLVITRAGIKNLLSKRMYFLLAISLIPFFIRAAQVYIVTRVEQFAQFKAFKELARKLTIDAGFFNDFLYQQMFFAILIIIVAGAGLIANDKRYRALQIYLSKPIDKWEYIVGKLLVVVFYLSLITLIPALLLFLTKCLLSENLDFLRQFYWVPAAISLHFVVLALSLGTLMLALSSLGKNSRYAGVGFFAIFLLSSTAFNLIKTILKNSRYAFISIEANLNQFGKAIFRQRLPHDSPLSISILVLVLIAAGSFFILRRNIQGTEIVK